MHAICHRTFLSSSYCRPEYYVPELRPDREEMSI
jgi:hypothetical protein